MNGGNGILRPEDIAAIESYGDGDGGDFDGMIECLGGIIADGIAEGRFTEADAHADLEMALRVAYACNNMDDYEHYCTACEWLSRVEGRASGHGVWFYRYANALLYTGRPRMALEYLLRGVDEEPGYPWCWLTLGRLKAHFGDRDGAAEAVCRGLAIVPGDEEFLRLAEDIESGASLESMEMGPDIDSFPEGIYPACIEAFWYGSPEISSRAEAVMGMVPDPKGIARFKEEVRPSGWIADHPYCTFMAPVGQTQVLVTLMMNEAFLSKIPADGVKHILDSLPEMETAARSASEAVGDRPLYGVMIDRRMGCTMTFGSFEDEQPIVARFDDQMNLLRPSSEGGPFVAMVLMSGGGFDPAALKRTLREDWGLGCAEDFEDGNMVFECNGHLAAYSMVSGPVPDGEAEENAANNYMWPGAVEAARSHTDHMIVALINHGGTPVEAALVHTRMVAAVCSQPCATGVYFQGTVIRPEEYIASAGGIRDGSFLPIDDWVWFGLYRTEDGGINAYTRGMQVLAKDEIEIIGARDDPNRIREFLYDVVSYVLENDMDLGDDDVISYGDGRILSVTLSPGVSLDTDTLKIEYPSPSEQGPSS